MRRAGSSALAAAAAVLALLVAGCGSQPLSSTDLSRQATRLCQLAGAQTDRIPTPSAPAGSAAYLRQGIAVLKPELAQLRALRPPDDVADVYTVSLSSFAKKLSYLNETLHDLDGGEDPVIAMKTLQVDLAPIEKQENGAWQTLQITACLNR